MSLLTNASYAAAAVALSFSAFVSLEGDKQENFDIDNQISVPPEVFDEVTLGETTYFKQLPDALHTRAGEDGTIIAIKAPIPGYSSNFNRLERDGEEGASMHVVALGKGDDYAPHLYIKTNRGNCSGPIVHFEDHYDMPEGIYVSGVGHCFDETDSEFAIVGYGSYYDQNSKEQRFNLQGALVWKPESYKSDYDSKGFFTLNQDDKALLYFPQETLPTEVNSLLQVVPDATYVGETVRVYGYPRGMDGFTTTTCKITELSTEKINTGAITHYGNNILGKDCFVDKGASGGAAIVGDEVVGNVATSSNAYVTISFLDAADLNAASEYFRELNDDAVYVAIAQANSALLDANVGKPIRPKLRPRVDFAANVPKEQCAFVVVQDEESTLNLRRGPSTQDDIITGLASGTLVTIFDTHNGWATIEAFVSDEHYQGHVSADYLSAPIPCAETM